MFVRQRIAGRPADRCAAGAQTDWTAGAQTDWTAGAQTDWTAGAQTDWTAGAQDGRGTLAAALSGAVWGTPSTYETVLASVACTRCPGVTIPTRFSGSHADRRTDLSASLLASCGPQRVDGVGRGELLADETAHQAAAAQLAAHLHPAVDADQIAPGGGVGLARQEIAEHHAVSSYVLAGERLVPGLLVAGGGDRVVAEHRPSPGADRAAGPAAPAGVPARAGAAARLRRRDERAQAREPVARDPSRGDQLAERVLDLGAQAACPGDDLVEEARPAPGRGERARRAPGRRAPPRRGAPSRAPAATEDLRAGRARWAPRGWEFRRPAWRRGVPRRRRPKDRARPARRSRIRRAAPAGWRAPRRRPPLRSPAAGRSSRASPG